MLKTMPLFEFKNRLMAKHDYSEELAETIAHVTESLVDFHGDKYEGTICNAVLNCKFIIAKRNGNKPADTIEETKKKNGLSENEVISTSDARSKQSEFVVKPNVSFKNSKFELDGVERAIILNANFACDSMDSIGLLVGEIEKLIKNSVNGVRLSGETLVTTNGLATTRYKLSCENGEVSKRQTSSVGVGLEDGLTEYARLAVMNTSYDTQYGQTGYNDTRIVATVLADSMGLKDSIFEAEMCKDSKELKTLIDENMEIGYDKFVSLIDRSYNLNCSLTKHVADPKKVNSIRDSIDVLFKNTLAPSLRDMEVKMRAYEAESKHSKL